MSKITFITGNQKKADFLSKHIGYEVGHLPLELDEIQSLDLRKITEHKVRQAFVKIKSPVLVEDVSLKFKALGNLPGPFIKWFLEELGNEKMCRLLDIYKDRSAVGEMYFAYFDGEEIKFFESTATGTISERPRGEHGFGWDPIFIPDGSTKTYGEMAEEEFRHFGIRHAIFPKIKEFLLKLDKK